VIFLIVTFVLIIAMMFAANFAYERFKKKKNG